MLERARTEIRQSWRQTCAAHTDHPRAAELFDPDKLPAFHDPFAGGGALPLEAQRLGLEAHASDLNPVAVLINKAMIEIPPKFAGQSPVNPEARRKYLGARASRPHKAWHSRGYLVSTDPPYYDNIGYADLSDFFYAWLRHSLKSTFPDLFATLAVPKSEELVATPYRHGSKKQAEVFFLEGMTEAMRRLAEQAHPVFPITIYYAFKQSETKGDTGTASTGWETFLDATIQAGLSVAGTWPIRTEKQGRVIGNNTNALASSIRQPLGLGVV